MAGNLKKGRLVVGEPPEDRLSFLPRELLILVLSFLPFHEAVKATALSKFWKRMWHSLPNLIFDYTQFPDMERKLDHFLEFIHQTLIHHDESNIKAFELYLRQECETRIKNEWVTFALQHNVEKLIIHGKAEDEQQLPDCLFTCRSLMALELAVEKLRLKWPVAISLPNLKKLSLASVILSEQNFMLHLSSTCPSLEILSFFSCHVMIVKVLSISAHSLKSLTIAACQGLEDCLIKLETPRLESFIYIDNVARNYKFTHAMSVSFACVMFGEGIPEEERGDSQCAIQLSLALCPGVEHITLNQFFIQFLARAHYHFTQLTAISFNKLEALTLDLWPTKEQVQTAFLLLSRCPKLGGIVVEIMRSDGWTPNMLDQDLGPVNLAFPVMLNQLTFVRIENFEGDMREMELVRLLLKSSPELRKMEIVMARDVSGADVEELSVANVQRKRMMFDILMFKRASAAIILFL